MEKSCAPTRNIARHAAEVPPKCKAGEDAAGDLRKSRGERKHTHTHRGLRASVPPFCLEIHLAHMLSEGKKVKGPPSARELPE